MYEEKNIEEETINIKGIILYYIQYWYYFILTVLFAISIAFLTNRYTIPEYSASTTLLIRDDNNTQMGAENLLEGLEMFSGKKNLKNEIIILNSYSLAAKVVEELELGISYFEHGFIKSNELFQTAPFKVNIDSAHVQLTGVDFFIEPINDRTFKLKIKTNKQHPYIINKEKLDKSLTADLNIQEIYSFNSEIQNKYYSFSINKSQSFNIDAILEADKAYSFKLHQKKKYAQQLTNSIIINPINKETSVLKISMTGNNVRKIKKILDKLTEVYIQTGLDEKNIMAINTIRFIDTQLEIIEDSLIFIEDQLEVFKIENPNLDIVDKDFGTFFQKQKLDNTLSEQSVNIKYYKSLLSYLKNENNANSIVSPTSMGISNPELNNLINQLLQLYHKKGDLELTTTNNHPTYQAILAQIENTKSTIIENVNNLIASALIYEKDLKSRITAFNSKITKLPEAEKRYLILKRKYEYNEQTTIYLL